MNAPYYNTQKKRWLIEITNKFNLEFQSEWKSQNYYNKHKDDN